MPRRKIKEVSHEEIAFRRGYSWLLSAQGLSMKEISKIVGVRPGTVSMDVTRLNRRLFSYTTRHDKSQPCESCRHDKVEHYEVSDLRHFIHGRAPGVYVLQDGKWVTSEAPRWAFYSGVRCGCGCTYFWRAEGSFMATELPPNTP